MAGAGSKGIPNGIPVDEWGIRRKKAVVTLLVHQYNVVVPRTAPQPSMQSASGTERRCRKYAPPGAASYDFYQSLPALSQGNVAQQIFWYTAFTASMVAPKSEGNNTRG